MDYNYFKNHQELFFTILKQAEVKNDKELEAFMYALLEIEDSMNKIYNSHVKDILENNKCQEIIQDKLWDIREEFRHIEYHINDAKLLE